MQESSWSRASLGVALASALWAAAPAAQAQQQARCFLIPQPGASATLSGESISTPRVSERCRELRVVAGTVQLVYTGAAGEPRTESVAAGATPVLAGLTRPTEAFDGVQRLLSLGVRDISAAGSGTKQYNAVAYTPASFGAPFGDLYVPPEGLVFRLYLPKPPAGQPALAVQDVDLQVGAGGTTTFAGRFTLGQEVRIPASALASGARHSVQLRMQTGGGTADIRGEFQVVDASRARDIATALDKVRAAGLTDGAGGSIARALVFEDDALGFNSRLSMLPVKP